MPQLHEGLQVVALEEILENPDNFDLSILSYPIHDRSLQLCRLGELAQLGVGGIVVTSDGDMLKPVLLGKGVRSVVLRCISEGLHLAAKVRRVDSPPTDFPLEAHHMSIASRFHIGPKPYGWTQNIILMQLIEGVSLGKALEEGRSPLPLSEILDQCFTLDVYGVDHGQLSDSTHHIIISAGRPVIIDYGHASTARWPRNVTSFTSYMFNRLGLNPRNLAPIAREYAKKHEVTLYQRLKKAVIEAILED